MKPISPNNIETEVNVSTGSKDSLPRPQKLDDFAAAKALAKPHIQILVKHLVREVNRHKMDYHQLRYLFRLVRKRCEVPVPTRTGRKLKELPSKTELDRFFAATESAEHRLIFETLLGTGLRVSELCHLQVSRMDLAGNLIFVNQGKGSKDRVVVIGNHLKEKLELYVQSRQNKFLFESRCNTHYSTRRIEQLCSRYKKKAAIDKELTPHTFRHIWNTRLAEEGIPEERRAVLAGHADNATQKIYTHLSAGGMKEEVILILDKVGRR